MKLLFFAVIALLVLVPGPAQAQDCVPPDCTPLPNPLASIGVSSPGDLIVKGTQGLVAIMGTIAIAFMVFSGFRLLIATNEESIRTAKSGLLWAVGGFALATLAFTAVSGTAALVGYVDYSQGNYVRICGFLDIGDCQLSQDFESVISYIMTSILELIGVVAVVMIIYYGYRYVVSSGNEQAIEGAKRGLLWSIVAIAIVIMAYTIIVGVQRILFEL